MSSPRVRFAGALLCLLTLVTPATVAHGSSKPVHGVQLYNGPATKYLVRLTGTSVCSGTLIASNQVLTAAHCVIDPRTGKPKEGLEVEYGGSTYAPAFAIYDQRFAEQYTKDSVVKDQRNDVAILTFTVKIGTALSITGFGPPKSGAVYTLGYQPTWEDGTLVRPIKYGDKSHLKPGINKFTQRTAMCSMWVSALKSVNGKLSGPCGMIPGGSGGPLVSIVGSKVYVHGVLSTVNSDLTTNVWADTTSIMRIVNRVDGVRVVSLTGPVVGGPPFRS